MPRTCPVTKKTPRKVGGYSNRVRATKYNPTGTRTHAPNLQKKKIFVPELGRSVRVKLSVKAMRTLSKKGIYTTLKKAGSIT
jgi:large subunit ribosomal protein L28